MSIHTPSPYNFAIISAGSRFPNVIMHSGDGGIDLAGHYALRELGIEAIKPSESSFGLIFSSLKPKPDFSTEVWVVDAWTSEDRPILRKGKNERKENVALVVKGLPNPAKAGHQGKQTYEALQRHLNILVEAIADNDQEAIDFNVSVLSALLGRVDQLRSFFNSRREVMRIAIITYAVAAIAAFAVMGVFELIYSAK